MGIDQRVIAGPELFDRKVRAKHAAAGAELPDRFADHEADMRRVVAMQEGAEAGQLHHDVGPLRQQRHAGAPGLEAGR